ncbi:radical SAM protein [Jannaschia sp.]|nr:radical SAM protein [Jannaschia sp.]
MTRTVPPPRFAFMEINKRCNLRCTHCDFWQRDDADKANYIAFDAKVQVLDELAAMNPDASLVICGGEPMLDVDDYFALAGAARDRGLRSLSVVNGTRIRRAEVAERMIREGPDEISISLNSHVPAIHDKTRGIPGAFDKAVRALRLLVEAKRKLGADHKRIYVMGLIFKSNYKLIDGFYDFVLNDIGADQLKLNFIQPSFGQLGDVDPFFAEEGEVDADEIMRIIEECDAKYRLNLSPTWIGQVGMYFRSLAKVDDREKGWAAGRGTDDYICNSYERNVMIDHYGTARLCFSDQFPGKRLEAPGDFTRFWNGANYIRHRMRRCNQFCGISHSVRRESSTLKGRDKMLAHQDGHGTFPQPGMAAELLHGLRAMAG